MVLDNEALNMATDEDIIQSCGELTVRFQIPSESPKLPLHLLGKAYKFSK